MRAGHCHCLKALQSVHLGHQVGLQHSFDSNGSHPCTFTLSANALIDVEALEAGDNRRMGFFRMSPGLSKLKFKKAKES